MNLKELKTLIEHKQKIDELIIFKCASSDFVAHQYIREIANYTDSEIILIDDITKFKVNSSFLVDNIIYIYKCDKLEDLAERFLNYNNLFIICKSIDTKTKKIFDSHIIDIPALDKWQILDYIHFNCPTVAKELEFMADKMDIYSIDNEISKISIFSKKKNELDAASFDEKELPKYILNSLKEDGSWNYLPRYSIFDLVQALILKDKKTVETILNMDIEVPVVLLYQLLYNQIKDIINIIVDRTATAESLGIKSGKYWAIKNTYMYLNKEYLEDKLEFLSSIDKLVKTGKISYDEKLLDIILLNFLGSEKIKVGK